MPGPAAGDQQEASGGNRKGHRSSNRGTSTTPFTTFALRTAWMPFGRGRGAQPVATWLTSLNTWEIPWQLAAQNLQNDEGDWGTPWQERQPKTSQMTSSGPELFRSDGGGGMPWQERQPKTSKMTSSGPELFKSEVGGDWGMPLAGPATGNVQNDEFSPWTLHFGDRSSLGMPWQERQPKTSKMTSSGPWTLQIGRRRGLGNAPSRNGNRKHPKWQVQALNSSNQGRRRLGDALAGTAAENIQNYVLRTISPPWTILMNFRWRSHHFGFVIKWWWIRWVDVFREKKP